MNNKQKILDKVFGFFINSRDFNGIPLTQLANEVELEYNVLIEEVKSEVLDNNISIQSSTNPHIIGFEHFNNEKQIQILEDAKNNRTKKIDSKLNISFDTHLVCAYPSSKYLMNNRDVTEFRNKPFTMELALGEPQLKPYFFEIEVLDRYFKDPRFRFDFEDYSGQISYLVDESQVPLVSESDRIYMQSFGLGVDMNDHRVAVVYLRYLNDLSSEHQIFWKSKEVNRVCKMRIEYYKNTIEGNWTISYSVFSAFIEEQKALNDLSKEIFEVSIFDKTFEKDKRPKEFTFFFIPTLKNYHDFVSLLDKMVSDNINKDFFKKQNMGVYEQVEIENGLFERKEKGTLRLLEEWLINKYITTRPDLLIELFKPFRTVRKERQSPAHKINENIYDKKFIDRQKELIKEAYFTMRTLRQIFQDHPKSRGVEITKWLDEGEIKIF